MYRFIFNFVFTFALFSSVSCFHFSNCGDGIQNLDREDCDDGNNVDGDGCGANCLLSVSQITASDKHTCALLNTGNVRCWGSNGTGQLGYGNILTIGDDESPASAGDVNVGGSVLQIAAGFEHTCALLNTGNVRCWGNGGGGRLGYSNNLTIGDDENPASAGDVNVGGSVLQIAAGNLHTCALLNTGNVRCWGSPSNGQLGYGNTNNIGDDESPAGAGDIPVF